MTSVGGTASTPVNMKKVEALIDSADQAALRTVLKVLLPPLRSRLLSFYLLPSPPPLPSYVPPLFLITRVGCCGERRAASSKGRSPPLPPQEKAAAAREGPLLAPPPSLSPPFPLPLSSDVTSLPLMSCFHLLVVHQLVELLG